jgi:hypothetical protein
MPWDRRIDHNRFEYFTRRFYFDGRKQGFPLEHFYETRVAARVRIAEDPSLRSADDADLPGRMPRARRLSEAWVARRQEKPPAAFSGPIRWHEVQAIDTVVSNVFQEMFRRQNN